MSNCCVVTMLRIWLTLNLLAISATYGSLNLRNEEGLDTGIVVLANILYRHGNRTIINPYPNDPYKNSSYWPLGWGQLTEDGMRGHYELGMWLRNEYSELLPLVYNPDDIYVQSTDVDRTLMSAEMNLAGLYARDPMTRWNPAITWRPIPIHTLPQKEDKVLSGKKPCPKYDYLLKKLKAGEWYHDLLKTYKELFATLTAATGKTIDDIRSAEYVYDDLFIEHLFGYTLPEWTKAVFPEPLKSLADLSFSMQCYTPAMARLKIGSLIGEMVESMDLKVKGQLKPDRRMFMHSGHDDTVANLLQALGVFNQLCPPYFSTVLLDLRLKDSEYFVTIQYRNSTFGDAHLLTLPGCTALCPFEKFKQIVHPIVPKDWERECQLTMLEEISQLTQLGMIIAASLASFVIISVGSVCFVCKRRRISEKDYMYQSVSNEAT